MEMSFNPLLINSTVRKYKLSYSFPQDNASQKYKMLSLRKSLY